MLALFNIQNWLESGGLVLLGLIVFAESGLLIGFFLPGDSLLFIAGFLSSSAGSNVLPPLPLVALVTTLCAIAGDQVGYWFGHRVGPALFDRPKSRVFNPKNVEKAHAFLEKYGAKTIVLARFVPVVRTFAPIVAGVGKMNYRTFVLYNIIGGVVWGGGVTTLGYFLGEVNFVKENIEIASLAIVALSIAPIAVEFIRHRRTSHQK
ncbi:MAG: VTT domain-containing protein [Ilumatobacteraceae bacterium]|jgi:membrane-associated protein|nr:VTT domain-containing protein [Ilumatobacteraceae bacterium]NQW60875.1 VTT domain-containing protein [bacterium]